MIIYLIIGIVALFSGFLLVSKVNVIFGNTLSFDEIKKAKILMIIMVINIAITFPASVFQSNVTANERYFFQKLLNLIKTVINPFLILPLLLLGFQSIGMVAVTTFLTVLTLFINIYYCINILKMQFSFKYFDVKLIKEIWFFSFFIFLNIIVDQINWNIDRFLLGMFQGTIAVAIYGISSQFNTMYLSFSGCISQLFIPKINSIVTTSNNNKQLNDLFCKIGRIQFIILSLIMTGFLFFGKNFIRIWAGEDYKDSYLIAIILMIPVTIELIQSIGMEILKAKNLHKFRSILFLILSIGNIAISIPLCIRYGGVGCAIGTALSLFLGNGLIINIYYYKKVGLDIFIFWKEIFRLSMGLILPIILGCLLNIFVYMDSTLIYFISIFVYIFVFCISMWKFGFNENEKKLFLSLRKNIKI